MHLWVFFKFVENVDVFVLACIDLAVSSDQISVDFAFSVSSTFKTFAMLFVSILPSDQYGTWAMVY